MSGYGLNTTEQPRDQSGRFISDVDRDEKEIEEELPGVAGELQVGVSPAGDAGMDSTGEGGSGDDTQSGPVIVSEEAMLRGQVEGLVSAVMGLEINVEELRAGRLEDRQLMLSMLSELSSETSRDEGRDQADLRVAALEIQAVSVELNTSPTFMADAQKFRVRGQEDWSKKATRVALTAALRKHGELHLLLSQRANKHVMFVRNRLMASLTKVAARSRSPSVRQVCVEFVDILGAMDGTETVLPLLGSAKETKPGVLDFGALLDGIASVIYEGAVVMLCNGMVVLMADLPGSLSAFAEEGWADRSQGCSDGAAGSTSSAP